MHEENNMISIETVINAPLKMVWDAYTNPAEIVIWNTTSEDWHTTKAEIDLKVGGKFSSRMEAKDGSFGFDFSGMYTQVTTHETIAYTMDDNRKANIQFTDINNLTTVNINFEPETENSIDLQQQGWQAILNNFKAYTEALM
jgi:uncharacterized protein YndB with AHSA1/START domain